VWLWGSSEAQFRGARCSVRLTVNWRKRLAQHLISSRGGELLLHSQPPSNFQTITGSQGSDSAALLSIYVPLLVQYFYQSLGLHHYLDMDPASITGLVATCVSIVSQASGFIKGIDDLRTRYKDVEINSQALVTQTGAVQNAASAIQGWLNHNGSDLGELERESIQDSLEACETLISAMLHGVRDVLVERSRGSTKWKFWDRVKFLWEQSQVDQQATRLNHQVAALSLHLQALQL
jgi:hypothetical protein